MAANMGAWYIHLMLPALSSQQLQGNGGRQGGRTRAHAWATCSVVCISERTWFMASLLSCLAFRAIIPVSAVCLTVGTPNGTSFVEFLSVSFLYCINKIRIIHCSSLCQAKPQNLSAPEGGERPFSRPAEQQWDPSSWAQRFHGCTRHPVVSPMEWRGRSLGPASECGMGSQKILHYTFATYFYPKQSENIWESWASQSLKQLKSKFPKFTHFLLLLRWARQWPLLICYSIGNQNSLSAHVI